MFEEVKAYKEEHGDCTVPRNYLPNPPLGQWVANQRRAYRCHMEAKQSGNALPSSASRISEERISLLEEVGFVSTTHAKSHNSSYLPWKERLVYKVEKGDCTVRDPPNPPLSRWVATQRTKYRLHIEAKKAGDSALCRSLMTEDHIAQLEAVGFDWEVSPGPHLQNHK